LSSGAADQQQGRATDRHGQETKNHLLKENHFKADALAIPSNYRTSISMETVVFLIPQPGAFENFHFCIVVRNT